MTHRPPTEVVTDNAVKQQILDVLSDGFAHDWDDAMIEVMERVWAVGLQFEHRQDERCLAELINTGQVKERWSRGGFATLKLVRQKTDSSQERMLFDDP